jgi:hypothetical protein
MTSDDLRRKNAHLRDRIEQVLEKHPELREIALRQPKACRYRVQPKVAMAAAPGKLKHAVEDLHVEVGTPFLERTQGKLQERAGAIIAPRPELEGDFDG